MCSMNEGGRPFIHPPSSTYRLPFIARSYSTASMLQRYAVWGRGLKISTKRAVISTRDTFYRIRQLNLSATIVVIAWVKKPVSCHQLQSGSLGVLLSVRCIGLIAKFRMPLNLLPFDGARMAPLRKLLYGARVCLLTKEPMHVPGGCDVCRAPAQSLLTEPERRCVCVNTHIPVLAGEEIDCAFLVYRNNDRSPPLDSPPHI